MPRTVAPEQDVEDFALRVARTLGLGDGTAGELAGGNMNHAVRVRTDRADVVVRFTRDAARRGDDPFDVEAWCAGAAARAGIRTAPVVARTHVEGESVLVVEHVAGVPTAPDDLAGWRAVGTIAARLAEVPTDDAPDGLFSRFGRDLAGAWDAHVAYNLEALGPDDALPGLGVYDRRDRGRLREVVASLRGRDLRQGLSHGDLCHRNLLTAADGGYVVLDWGSAQAGPTPWTDLEQIRRWHVTGDVETPVSAAAWAETLAGALDGTGTPPDDAARILGSLAVLHALDVVRWALDRRPDRLAELAAGSAATVRRELPRLG
ncbi:phosphotransferase [Luteimicrobium sp. DT211]|uniref:phosphotransferase n=1 Tax=Luteimicrobium sp. DT211 TaxID=3393412 RepID=UPI003CF3A849